MGEAKRRAKQAITKYIEPMIVDTPGGRIHVQWDKDANATSNGQLAFFAEFLHAAGLFEAWVQDCPLHYTSPNAPTKYDVLGTLILSILAGHNRYAHITALRNDGVSNFSIIHGNNQQNTPTSYRRNIVIPANPLSIFPPEGERWIEGWPV